MKLFKTIDEQIAILQSRNMTINDETFAKEVLLYRNYYTIVNGYDDIFIATKSPKTYVVGSTFEGLASIAFFDQFLRTFLLDLFCTIEHKLRSIIAYEFSIVYTPYGYLSESSFRTSNQIEQKYTGQLIQKLHETANLNSYKPYISKFLSDTKPVPLWAFINAMSFGELKMFYKNMNFDEQTAISNHFSLNPKILISFLEVINDFRNICAHHERAYCFKSTVFKDDKEYPKNIRAEKFSSHFNRHKQYDKRNDLFALLIITKYFVSNQPYMNNTFNQLNFELEKLALDLPPDLVDAIITKQMTLPSNWMDLRDL